MWKLGSRVFEPIAFFMTSVSMSGPISASSGTSLNLTTGIGESPPVSYVASAGPAGQDAKGQVDFPQVPVQVRHANRGQVQPHRLPTRLADGLVVLRPGIHLGLETGSLVFGKRGVVRGHVGYRVEVALIERLHPLD